MRKIIFYTAIFLWVLSIASCVKKDAIPDLRETYNRKDKNPFGSYVMYNYVEDIFSSHSLKDNKTSFDDFWRYETGGNSLYICVAKNLFLNEDEVHEMLDYVKKGNDLFISAATIDEMLLNKIGCQLSFGDFGNIFLDKPLKNTDVALARPHNIQATEYQYFYLPFVNYFYGIHKANIKVLSNNERGKPNCIVVFYGEGRFFLHCDPRAFSNYFLLQRNNYQYLQNLLNYTRAYPGSVYWDDYYNKLKERKNSKNSSGFSAMDTIFKHPPLKLAFWLLLVLLLLYILFQGKRRQRIISPLKVNENTSVAFTETIGRLYLQKKDNYNIAQKMITYFNEYIRNSYFLNTSHIDEAFLATLSRKSGVDKNQVDGLFRLIQQIKNNADVNDFMLLALNEQIQSFFKSSGMR